MFDMRPFLETAAAQDIAATRYELEDSTPLAACEYDDFQQILNLVTRHQFFDHNCQTTVCLARFIWDSSELAHLLSDAYHRGFKHAQSEARGGTDAE
jgi:hypothetical protein